MLLIFSVKIKKNELLFLSTIEDSLNTLNKFQTSNIKLQTMTTININDNLFNFKSNLGKKSEKPKPGRSAKLHRTDDYWLKMHNAERRKQTKVRHDTHRRDEQPDAEDIRLEDIHFANFLGLPRSEDGIPYNNVHINEPVNIIECDIFLKPESSRNAPEEAVAPQEEEGYGSWAPQISREPNTKWNMNWIYEPEIQTLTGYSTFKRGLDEEAEEEQLKKRAKEQDRETAIFESMVTYMREQLELAQAMIDSDELYVCDCEHK